MTDPEPLPKGHPLWKFDNVIITPHIAGRSDYDTVRMFAAVKEDPRRFVDGKPLINVMDKKKGYWPGLFVKEPIVERTEWPT